jgi:hypothetical protein
MNRVSRPLVVLAVLAAALVLAPVAGAQTTPTNPSGNVRGGVPMPQIDRFYVSPNNTLKPGTTLKFVVKGTANGKAFLTIPGETDPMPMKEVKPGLYERSYTIKPDDRLSRDVTFRADLKEGQNVVTSTLKPGQDAVTSSQGVVK